MANKNINDLPTATSLNAGDKLEILQGGTNKQIDVSLLGGGSQSLQDVTDIGSTTTNVIEAAGVIADSFVTPLGLSTIYEDGAYFYQGDAATELFNVDNNTDLVTYKEKEIAVIEAAQTTGVALTFLTDSVYGTIGTPETGNITYSATNAKLGVTNLIIHNHSVAPTFAANMKESSGSLGYSLSVINYIWVTYINSTEVLYRIEQRA